MQSMVVKRTLKLALELEADKKFLAVWLQQRRESFDITFWFQNPPPLIFSENASHKIHQSFATNSNSKNRNESKYARLVCLKPKGISKNPFSSSHLICENPWRNSVHLAFFAYSRVSNNRTASIKRT